MPLLYHGALAFPQSLKNVRLLHPNHVILTSFLLTSTFIMVEMRQPFYSIVSAVIFGGLGLAYGIQSIGGFEVVFGGIQLSSQLGWAISGVLFLMAYFSIAHLQTKKK